MQAAVEAVVIGCFWVFEVAFASEALPSAEPEHESVVGDFVDLEGILDLMAWKDVELVGETEPPAFASTVDLRRNASDAGQ